ncbi:hypothetical protein F2P56_012775 [Juglans regia]|uniref:Uncharacterized protein n=1 Tax=Juglans regia TaxID=51240 RepID=A0A834CXI5_JUGRE|nr:hypothetical protein F2P56_012775 [Juglans regia]
MSSKVHIVKRQKPRRPMQVARPCKWETKKLYSQNRKEKMELLKGLTLGRDDKANISPLLQEVLIVWGDCDKIFPSEMATELKVLLGGKTRLEVIKNTSHVPQIECPGQFNNVIRCFLTGSS